MTTLNLRNSEVGDHGAYQMFVSLQFNLFSKLTKVTLSENHVGNKAVAAIAAVLKCNRIMKYLDLKVNSIGDEGAICLAEALEVNSTLENLDLSGNWIADKGANRIATALTRNYSLVTFFLSKNRITEEGILNVIRALKRNQGLEEINIRDNFFMERTVVHTLNATLKVNASLTKVDFTQFTTTSNETRELLSINTNYMPWRRMAKAWPKTHFLLPNKDNEIECLLIIFALYSIPKEIKIAIIRTIILTKLTNKIAQFK
uniref:Uncharacterized protein n=1 Tax=Arcella intermedia TaxID=1963864 RepID=A0A6B2LDV9_9EUKA